jgi:hypothetical protein
LPIPQSQENGMIPEERLENSSNPQDRLIIQDNHIPLEKPATEDRLDSPDKPVHQDNSLADGKPGEGHWAGGRGQSRGLGENWSTALSQTRYNTVTCTWRFQTNIDLGCMSTGNRHTIACLANNFGCDLLVVLIPKPL